jgi:hypothetical protein
MLCTIVKVCIFDIFFVKYVTDANNNPPQIVSVIAALKVHFLKIAPLVVSNTPYTNIPNINASLMLLFLLIIK